MKITFLGTGTSQGVPVIGCNCKVCKSEDPKDNRLRASILIETKKRTFIIDTGPDFRTQMLREKKSDIDAVIYTHEHRDHIAGLDDIRPINFLKQKSIDLYAEDRVLNALKQTLPYAFGDNKYPGVPELNLHTISNHAVNIKGINFTPIRVYHYKLPVLGFRIGDFTYITDANYIPEEEKEKIIGTKYLVINALRQKKHISHFTLTEASEIIREFSPRKAFITHISHQMGLTKEVDPRLPENTQLAYDGLQLDI
mgnify:FL=1